MFLSSFGKRRCVSRELARSSCGAFISSCGNVSPRVGVLVEKPLFSEDPTDSRLTRARFRVEIKIFLIFDGGISGAASMARFDHN